MRKEEEEGRPIILKIKMIQKEKNKKYILEGEIERILKS